MKVSKDQLILLITCNKTILLVYKASIIIVVQIFYYFSSNISGFMDKNLLKKTKLYIL